MTDLPGLLKALKIMTVMNGKAWRCSPAALDELNAAIAAERQSGEGLETDIEAVARAISLAFWSNEDRKSKASAKDDIQWWRHEARAAISALRARPSAERQSGEGREDVAFKDTCMVAGCFADEFSDRFDLNDIAIFGRLLTTAHKSIAALRARPSGTFAEGVETFSEVARALHTACWKALIHLGNTNDRIAIIGHYNDFVTPDDAARALRDALMSYREVVRHILTPPSPPEVRGDNQKDC